MNELYLFIKNILFSLLCLLFVRIFILYLRIRSKKTIKPKLKAKLMVILGSGGHTSEMFLLLKNISMKATPRIYCIADTDVLSEKKAMAFEEDAGTPDDLYIIEKLPRSREVGQSWLTTIFSTLRACFYSLLIVMRHKPDAILCNGPGTCIPICLSSLLIHVLGIKRSLIIFVESICRVKTLSLSGKLLYYVSDYFYVQWPELKEYYSRAQYIGRLV